jgi:hypothetical protein
MSLQEAEFTALRRTITARGTARMILFPVTILGWATFPLAVLVGGFEAIHALHAGVERIGRYLQVYYEDAETGPRWENTVMAVGPALPGGGIDPLFSFVFACAAFVNIIPTLGSLVVHGATPLPAPTRTELGVIGILHLAFVIRVVRARGAAARQRAVELETFRAIHTQIPNPKSQTPKP